MDYKICRLCLTNHREKALLKIFGQEGMDDVVMKLQSCLPFKISVFDNLPKYICYNCMALLDQTYKFIKNAVHSNEVLQNNGGGASKSNKAITQADKSGEICDDDDINFSHLGRMHSSVTIERRHATWVLSQHSSQSNSSSDEDGGVDLQPKSHRTPPALLEQEENGEKSTQNSSEPLSVEKSTQESMLSECNKKHSSPMETSSQSKIQKTECKPPVPSYPSAFQPVPYPFHMYPYPNNHSVFQNNTPQIQSTYIPNSNYQPLQVINNSQASNIGYQFIPDGNAHASNTMYQIPPNTPQLTHPYFSNPNGYIQNHNLSYQIPNTHSTNGISSQHNSYPNMCFQIPNTSLVNQTVASETIQTNIQDPICYQNSQNPNGTNKNPINALADNPVKHTESVSRTHSNNNQTSKGNNGTKPINNVTTSNPNSHNNDNQASICGNSQIINDNSDIKPMKCESQSSMKSISQENKENIVKPKNKKSPVTPNSKPLTHNNLTPMFDNSCGLDLNYCKVCSVMLSPHDNIFAHMLHSHEKKID